MISTQHCINKVAKNNLPSVFLEQRAASSEYYKENGRLRLSDGLEH